MVFDFFQWRNSENLQYRRCHVFDSRSSLDFVFGISFPMPTAQPAGKMEHLKISYRFEFSLWRAILVGTALAKVKC